MRQRVIIAMALALNPELVIMDEPTTALDVVVQREILQQIQDLQAQLGFAVLFITHDLSLLFEIAHRIAIMYAGEVVEEGPAAELPRRGAAPLHARPDRVVPAADRADRADDRNPRLAAGPRVAARRLPLPSTLPALRAGAEPRCTRCRRRCGPCCTTSGPATGWRAISWSSRDDDLDLGADRGARADEALRRRQRARRPRPPARRRRRHLHAARRARSPRSSARAAAARAPSRACSPACTSRRAAASSSRAKT